MTAQFPAEFYTCLTRGASGPTPNDHVDEFPTDSGKAMLQKMAGSPEEIYQVPMRMSRAQLFRFMNWFRVDCGFRATSFYMQDRIFGDLGIFRHLSPPAPVEIGADLFRVVMTLAREG